jgi:hypothetical protein
VNEMKPFPKLVQTGGYVTFVEARKLLEKESVCRYISFTCLAVQTQSALKETSEPI